MIRFWTWLNFFSLTFLSSFLYFAWIFVADRLDSLFLSRSLAMIWGTWHNYLIVLLNVALYICYEVGAFIISNLIYIRYDVLIKVMERSRKLYELQEHYVIEMFSRKKVSTNKVMALS